MVTVPSIKWLTNDIEVHKIFENLKVIASCGEPLKLDLLKFFIQALGLLYNFMGLQKCLLGFSTTNVKKKTL